MLREEQVDLLVAGIVDELLKSEAFDKKDASGAAKVITRIIHEEEKKLEKVNEKANEIMRQHSGQMWQEGVNQRVMFQKIRAKLAEDEGIVI